MNTLELILLCVLYYFIGAIPVSYLLFKWKTGKDITKTGSGNSGALNAYESSGSKILGIIVLVLDFIKGFIPSFILYKFTDFEPAEYLIPVLFLVVGHNFNIWLKFRGGRGLATAAGISAVFSLITLLVWCILFLISFSIIRKVHFGNITASVLLSLMIYVLHPFLEHYDYMISNYFDIYISFLMLMCLLILLKHITPFIQLIKNN